MDSSIRKGLIIGIVIGVVVGLLLGMLLFWQVFPVKWSDAHSYDLAPEAKAEYMGLVADSFSLNKDPAAAARYLESWTDEEKQQAAADALQMYEQTGQAANLQRVQDLTTVLAIPVSAEAAPTPAPIEAPVSGIWSRLRVPCLVFLLVLLALVLALLGIQALRRRRSTARTQATGEQSAATAPRPEQPRRGSPVTLGRFQSTYQLGEDTYDESFTIEGSAGEFLGECGMGISETIGEGEPDKVTAFEVWLFDKSDIRTVTKVLMSENAYHDEALRSKLASKGEAVLAEPGSVITLDTGGLQAQVEVTELEYGVGDLPPNSFFAKLVVEMVAAAKALEPRAGDGA